MVGFSKDPNNAPANDPFVQAVCDWLGPSDLVELLGTTDKVQQNTEGSDSNRFDPNRKALNDVHADYIEKLLGGTDMLAKARLASPINNLSSDCPPFLLLHGDKDTLIPKEQSEKLYKALIEQRSDATLILVPGASHGPGLGIETKLAVIDFFDRTLKRAEKPI